MENVPGSATNCRTVMIAAVFATAALTAGLADLPHADSSNSDSLDRLTDRKRDTEQADSSLRPASDSAERYLTNKELRNDRRLCGSREPGAKCWHISNTYTLLGSRLLWNETDFALV